MRGDLFLGAGEGSHQNLLLASELVGKDRTSHERRKAWTELCCGPKIEAEGEEKPAKATRLHRCQRTPGEQAYRKQLPPTNDRDVHITQKPPHSTSKEGVLDLHKRSQQRDSKKSDTKFIEQIGRGKPESGSSIAPGI